MTTLPLSRSGRQAHEVATEAAKKAGEILRNHLHDATKVHYKGRANIVTDVDLRVEEALISFLRDEYPDHSVISEESEPTRRETDYTWVLDPLDGTNNFSFGIPFFCTVIALTNGIEPLLGIVYDPLRGEMFSAQKGRGAFLNGERIAVSKKRKVHESLIGLDLGYVDENGRSMLRFITDLWPNMYAFRLMGSAALGMAYAACGRLDLYFHILLYPWELACGQLLVGEAGGIATDWGGRAPGVGQNSIVASNQAVHGDFLSILRGSARV